MDLEVFLIKYLELIKINKIIKLKISDYNIMKNTINIIFIVIIILIIILITNINEDLSSISNDNENIIINRNNQLIKDFRFYMEDLQFYINRDNEYYVKNTNKNYGKYILNMHRYRDYYKNRILLMLYPVKLRQERNNYYIDYKINGQIIPNKVYDESWSDFEDSYPNIWGFNNPTNKIINTELKNFPSKAIITIYSTNNKVYEIVNDILKNFNNYEIQICTDKFDLLLNKALSLNKISEILGGDLFNKVINDNLGTSIDNATGFLTKNSILKSEQISEGINAILNSEQFNQIISSKEISSKLDKYNLGDINRELTSDNAQVTIETRNDKYVFIYNIHDDNQKEELINLLDYIQDPEDLAFRRSFNKKLKFTKLPINPYRILISFRKYNMI
jgi:hypothetical protein